VLQLLCEPATYYARAGASLNLQVWSFCVGLNAHTAVAAAAAAASAVGYPLAPEQRFPAGLLGAVAAYDWLVQQLGGSEHIVLGA
jgi:acetyl esterase/lipase